LSVEGWLEKPGRVFRAIFDRLSLPLQMILGFVFVVVLTTVTIGVPTIWLLRHELDRQAWALVDQGVRAADAFCAVQQREIVNFATLTAERPTLHRLLGENNRRDLFDYLVTIKNAVGYDLIVVCDMDDQVVSATENTIPDQICVEEKTGGIYLAGNQEFPQALMTATHPVSVDSQTIGFVIVANRIDHTFATQMQAFSGLENTLLINGQIVASSFDENLTDLFGIRHQLVGVIAPVGMERSQFELDGQPYYAEKVSLEYLGVSVEVALLVADIVLSQQRLLWLLIGGNLGVALLVSALGVYISRQISQPLVDLAETAVEFSRGELGSPVSIEARVREAVLVGQALESARVNLLQTLTDLRREKVWTNHLLESIVEGIMTLDEDNHIAFFSHGAERITGWTRADVLNRSCDEFFKPVDIELPFSQVIPSFGMRKRIVVQMAGERVATLAITGAHLTLPEAGEAQIALVFRDISEEDLIHHLLGHFIANIVHEFRTPLAALNASIELLLDLEEQGDPAERQALLQGLQVSVINLQTLVDNLLESASFEAGHFRVWPRPYELSDLVSEAVRIMQPLLEKYGQELQIELPQDIPLIQVDPRRTVQVLVNLLSNASKYGPPDAEIVLTASVETNRVRVKVVDRGPGISPKKREKLFQRFTYRGMADTDIRVGVGLGLSVVKAIVEAQGGKTGVDTPPGDGTVFWFTLPVAEEP